MEDYGKFTFRSSEQTKLMDAHQGCKNEKRPKKSIGNLKSKCSDSKKRIHTSSDFQDTELLKLHSKHNSRVGKQKKQAALEQDFEMQKQNKDNFQDKFNFDVHQSPDKLTRKQQSQPFEPDIREQNILVRKQISNLRYLMTQTKEMMNLLQALIIQDDIKILKGKLLETEINVRRLRIGSRKRSKQNKVITQYYKNADETIRRSRNVHRRNLNNLISSRKYSCEYDGAESKTQFSKTRGHLLRARARSIKQYIQVEKTKTSRKQQLLKNEIALIRRQSQNFQEMTRRTNRFLSGIENKMSNLTALVLSSNLKESRREYGQQNSHKLQIKSEKSVIFDKDITTKVRYSEPACNQYLLF